MPCMQQRTVVARAYPLLQNQKQCSVHEILDRQVQTLQHLHLGDHILLQYDLANENTGWVLNVKSIMKYPLLIPKITSGHLVNQRSKKFYLQQSHRSPSYLLSALQGMIGRSSNAKDSGNENASPVSNKTTHHFFISVLLIK